MDAQAKDPLLPNAQYNISYAYSFFKGMSRYLQKYFNFDVVNHEMPNYYVAQNQTNYIYWFTYSHKSNLNCHFKFSFDRQTSIIELIDRYFERVLENETYIFDDNNRDQMMQNLPNHLKSIIENDIAQHELYSPQAKLDNISCVIRVTNKKSDGQKSCWFKYSYPILYQAPFQKLTFIYKINEEADPVEFQLRNIIELRQLFFIYKSQGLERDVDKKMLKSKWNRKNPKNLLINITRSSLRAKIIRAYILNYDTSTLQLFQIQYQALNLVSLLVQIPLDEAQTAKYERSSKYYMNLENGPTESS